VSSGLLVDYVGDTFHDSGYLVGRLNVISSHSTTTPPLNRDDFTPKYKIVRYKDGMTILPKHVGIEAQHYNDLSATAGIENWEAVTVFVEGADSTTPQSAAITLVQNVELLPIANTAYSLLATPAGGYEPRALQQGVQRNSQASTF
jgi:hypothetical protein